MSRKALEPTLIGTGIFILAASFAATLTQSNKSAKIGEVRLIYGGRISNE